MSLHKKKNIQKLTKEFIHRFLLQQRIPKVKMLNNSTTMELLIQQCILLQQSALLHKCITRQQFFFMCIKLRNEPYFIDFTWNASKSASAVFKFDSIIFCFLTRASTSFLRVSAVFFSSAINSSVSSLFSLREQALSNSS